jgi:hypothetical protein
VSGKNPRLRGEDNGDRIQDDGAAGDRFLGLQMANITLDWMLDGAVKAGAIVGAGSRYDAASSPEFDALAESARRISLRTVPAETLLRAASHRPAGTS